MSRFAARLTATSSSIRVSSAPSQPSRPWPSPCSAFTSSWRRSSKRRPQPPSKLDSESALSKVRMRSTGCIISPRVGCMQRRGWMDGRRRPSNSSPGTTLDAKSGAALGPLLAASADSLAQAPSPLPFPALHLRRSSPATAPTVYVYLCVPRTCQNLCTMRHERPCTSVRPSLAAPLANVEGGGRTVSHGTATCRLEGPATTTPAAPPSSRPSRPRPRSAPRRSRAPRRGRLARAPLRPGRPGWRATIRACAAWLRHCPARCAWRAARTPRPRRACPLAGPTRQARLPACLLACLPACLPASGRSAGRPASAAPRRN
mmetsp:Transcript_23163/g.65761  ORF Transcript_23163/g.65761 Transcript_23163/m.65761 type:complete len:317 (-) Transcript_23163:207-1157(-)